MGCDVHMYVEKYNNNTKSWESVRGKFINTNYVGIIVDFMSDQLGTSKSESAELLVNYLMGEKPKNKFEQGLFTHFLPNEIPTEPNDDWYTTPGKLPYPYTDEPYQGRNYNLFGILAGVRTSGVGGMDKIIEWERGLPDDASADICSLSDDWGVDGHSHNHIYMDEILKSKYYKMSEEELNDIGLGTSFFHDTVNSVLHFVGGDPKDIRLVFWFDN